MSKKVLFLAAYLIFVCLQCSGQVKRSSPNDSLTGPGSILHGQVRIKKNHFYPHYPDEMFFMQCGLQDRLGNMWFGAAGDGIYYYDGKAFLNFTKNEGLCHNDILCCMEDKSGIIWFGTRNGLIMFKRGSTQPQKSDFTSFLISQNTIRAGAGTKVPYTYVPADNFVWNIYQDNNNIIWFCTNKGVYLCNPALDMKGLVPVFTEFIDHAHPANDSLLVRKEIQDVMQDRKGNMWFITGGRNGSIVRYDGRSLTKFRPDTLDSEPGYLNTYRSILERKNGDVLFLHTTGGVYLYDGAGFSNLSKEIGITRDTLVSMAEDQDGNLWFGHNSENIRNGGDGGLWRFDGRSLRLFTIKDGLSHNCVFSIIPDKDGNVWFGTRNTGLCRYNGKTFLDFSE